jgi:hypothetical protein
VEGFHDEPVIAAFAGFDTGLDSKFTAVCMAQGFKRRAFFGELRVLLHEAGVFAPIKSTMSQENPSPLIVADETDLVPGSVVGHRKSDTGEYIGSPSIAILPGGAYVASHDVFGPGTAEFSFATTFVYRSEDRGETWRQVARVEPAFWSNLFVHGGMLYLLGTTHHHGLLVIRRSDDGGFAWTQPKDAASGLLAEGNYHTAPMPMLIHGGRLWRAIEDAGLGGAWGERYQPVLMSAPVGADLLRSDSWTLTRPLANSKAWLDGAFGGWLEGNALVLPSGHIGDLLRVAHPRSETAALALLSDDGKSLEFSAESGFVHLDARELDA